HALAAGPWHPGRAWPSARLPGAAAMCRKKGFYGGAARANAF
ncbi:hypothetical protein HMPREF0731_3786, partial [Pseudoroseomonas cervicalis ATCC 49957]